MTVTTTTTFATRLLHWYDRHGRRNLPWQGGDDAYPIWVAEIMLQQTQVATVLPYYRKFMAQFPSLSALADCDVDALLHCWSGLGYYARARNLRLAARRIMDKHDGKFPTEFADVLALPGIGRSTAGAILSFAYSQRHAILDGNVKRVLTRYFALTEPLGVAKTETKLWCIADELTPTARVADYNQAIMDLGATVCTRAKPRCESCPVGDDCVAYRRGETDAYPVRKAKATVRVKRAVVMLIVRNRRGELLLVKRPPVGIWGGLWSLPEYDDDGYGYGTATTVMVTVTVVTTTTDGNGYGDDGDGNGRGNRNRQRIKTRFQKQFGITIKPAAPLPKFRHSFTHFDLEIRPLPATVTATTERIMDDANCLWYSPKSPAKIGLPTAVKRILDGLADQ